MDTLPLQKPQLAVGLLAVLLCAGCYGPMAKVNIGKVQTDDDCLSLYQAANLSSLVGKIPIQPTDVPTRSMLMESGAPTEEEIQAIKKLEETDRSCREIRANNKNRTTATEDILASRISKLRYGLFNGDIPYAVYNYGVAKAMKEQNAFHVQGQEAFARGREIGGQKAAAFNAQLQQIQTQNQLNSIQNQLNTYNYNSTRSWNCNFSTLRTGSTVYYNCY